MLSILIIMLFVDVKSFWVDVIYNSETWVYSESMEEFKSDIDFPERNNITVSDSRSCLTLQLTDEQNLILVPSYCTDFSRMLCVSGTKLIVLTYRV